MWHAVKNGITIGQRGSENGTIIKDEIYSNSCRITLERCNQYSAITCGIYGLMVHTAFCDEDNSDRMYTDMKRDLQSFIDSDTPENGESEFCEYFTSTY